MAAAYVKFKKGDLFKQISPDSDMIKVSVLDALFDETHIIFTQVTYQLNEVIQFSLPVGGDIRALYFGAGLGSLTLVGECYADETETFAGSLLGPSIAGAKGQVTDFTIPGWSGQAMLTSATSTVLAEPTTMISFNIQLAVMKATPA